MIVSTINDKYATTLIIENRAKQSNRDKLLPNNAAVFLMSCQYNRSTTVKYTTHHHRHDL